MDVETMTEAEAVAELRKAFAATPVPVERPAGMSPREKLDRGITLTPDEWERLPQWKKNRTPKPAAAASVGSQPLLFKIDGRDVTLRNQYKGATAFLICGGPSFAEVDHSRLRQPGILTMGVNNSVKTFRPNLWVAVDEANHFLRSIWYDPTITKFFPQGRQLDRIFDSDAWAWTDRRVTDCPNVVLYQRHTGFKAETFLTEPTICWGNDAKQGGGRSVMLVAIRLLYELGIRRVFLLGADFNMQAGKSYHFDQAKSQGAANSNNATYRVLNERFTQLRPIFEQHGFHVYNCNPRSKLTAFDHVPYDRAVQLACEAFGVADTAAERTAGLYTDKKPSTDRVDPVPDVVQRLRRGGAAKIPKILHFVWMGSEPPEWATANIARARELHPGWEVKVYRDLPEDMPDSLRAAAGACGMWCLVSDIIRWWVLYRDGGIYIDADVVLTRSLDPLLSLDPFISESDGIRPYCAVAGSPAGHDAIKALIDNIEAIHRKHGAPPQRADYGPNNCKREASRFVMLPVHLFYPRQYRPRAKGQAFMERPLQDQIEELRSQSWPWGMEPFGVHVFGLTVNGVRSSFAATSSR